VIAWEMCDSPEAVARIPATTSSTGDSFRTYPHAPASTASVTSSSSLETLNTRTRLAGARAVKRRVASSPDIPGILRSMTTTSGAVSSTARIAASPLGASPTTSMPRARSERASPRR
jgi:hypothetical protein